LLEREEAEGRVTLRQAGGWVVMLIAGCRCLG